MHRLNAESCEWNGTWNMGWGARERAYRNREREKHELKNIPRPPVKQKPPMATGQTKTSHGHRSNKNTLKFVMKTHGMKKEMLVA